MYISHTVYSLCHDYAATSLIHWQCVRTVVVYVPGDELEVGDGETSASD